MKEQLQHLLRNGHLDEAKAFVEQTDFDVWKELLIEISFDDADESTYLFVDYLLQQQESSTYHDLAYLLMALPLCHLERAYFTAYKHAKRAVELTEYTDTLLLENLLFLHGVPDQVVSDEEAADVAQKILMMAPSHRVANEWMRDYKRRS